MSKKQSPSFLRALGRGSLPQTITVAEGTFDLVRVFKHDFFAVTALYAGQQGKLVLKIGRKAGLFGVPLGWIGRLLARHEAAVYKNLTDLSCVPRFFGRYGRHGIIHEYVEGHPLRKGELVADDFFGSLATVLRAIHDRRMAYVDLEKCENVLVGDDGKPYLVDFQISWRLPARYGGELWPARWLRRRLQQADWYHMRKLQRRCRPDQLSEQEILASYQKPFYVRLHAVLTGPLTRLRRGLLMRLDPKVERSERGRLPDPPDATEQIGSQ